MRTVIIGVLMLAAALFGGPAGAAQSPRQEADRQAVEEAFVAARTALMAGDGATALPYLSRGTLERVETIRGAARSGRSVDGLSPSEKFAVLGLRRYLTPAQLKRMRAEDLADHALAERWLGPNIIAQSSIDSIKVAGDRASARLLVKRAPALLPVHFVREAGGWKIDLTRTLALSDQMLRTVAAMSGQTEDEAVAGLLEQLAERTARR